MVNKAADAVNKMTIKMNESDAVSKGGRMEVKERKRGSKLGWRNEGS